MNGGYEIERFSELVAQAEKMVWWIGAVKKTDILTAKQNGSNHVSVLPVMLRFSQHLLPLLINALKEDKPDDMYKYFMLVRLVRDMPFKYRDALISVLKRLIENLTTEGEKSEEVDMDAKGLLEEWKNENLSINK